MSHRPSWFRDGEVLTSAAPTCGINKDGLDQFVVDFATGSRSDEIDDALRDDVEAVYSGAKSSTLSYVPLSDVLDPWRAVPIYFDDSRLEAFHDYVQKHLPGWDAASLGELIDNGVLTRRDGHGSPSLDQRTGSVPYIKVSDIRAGLVNINPTNMIPKPLAEQFWRGSDSGLRAFDLLSPERASKNIGDFAMLMPGQEQVVLTREVIVLRVVDAKRFDPFYLQWALTLNVVRRQWDRVIFMQTNREDVGHRYREIIVPVPPSLDEAKRVSEAFRSYYTGIAKSRQQLGSWLAESRDHHFFVSADPNTSAND
jgi:hypothetical protein